MKKKNAIMVLTMVLTLAMSGTCVACGSEQKEQKQESTTEVKNVEKKTTDNKKENEKVQENVLSDAKVDTVEANTENESEAENVSSTNETSSNGNGNTGNASVTNASSGNHTGNSGSVSSGSNTGSNTGNNSGNSSASATPSGNNSNSNNNSNSGPAQTAHTHTWVHVEATGHYETVVVQDAWDEEVPVYENVAHDICNQCGADITGNTTEHNMKHALAYEPGGWHTEWRYEQTGTQKVHHDAITEQRWVQDSPAYDVCSGCGATK